MSDKYSMLIQWSDEDQVYAVSFPEFEGAHTHGDSYTEAAKNGREVLELLLESFEGTPQNCPKPIKFGCPVSIPGTQDSELLQHA